MSLGPKLAVGLYIPNLDFAWKLQSAGPVGLPDGWTASPHGITDLLTTPRIHWVPRFVGGGITASGAYLHGSGRALRVVAPAALANDAARYLVSPAGPYGQLPGGEPASSPYFASESVVWWARIRLLFKGTTAPTNNWSIQLRQLSADETTDALCGSLTIAPGSWTGDWVALESAPIAIDLTSAGLDHIRLRPIIASGPGAGSSVAIFDHMAVETLGPVDFAEQLAGAGASLVDNDHDTFYQFRTAPRHDGSLMGRPQSLAVRTVMPNGSSVWYDPSGGLKKRRFEISYGFLWNVDNEKLMRLFYANKGDGVTAGGLGYGQAYPLLVTSTAPYYQRSVYVDIDAAAYPAMIDNTWQSAIESGAKWKVSLPMVER